MIIAMACAVQCAALPPFAGAWHGTVEFLGDDNCHAGCNNICWTAARLSIDGDYVFAWQWLERDGSVYCANKGVVTNYTATHFYVSMPRCPQAGACMCDAGATEFCFYYALLPNQTLELAVQGQQRTQAAAAAAATTRQPFTQYSTATVVASTCYNDTRPACAVRNGLYTTKITALLRAADARNQ